MLEYLSSRDAGASRLSVAEDSSPARRVGAVRQLAEGAGTFALAVSVSVIAHAQSNSSQGTGNRHFTAAPIPKGEEDGLDMIFGIHVNTLFFIAVGVIALIWFTVGGGRKVKLGRPQQ